MAVVEFYEMRLSHFFLKLHYYNKKKQYEMELAANLTRMQTLALVNIQLDKKDRFRDPRKFWLFPWENEEEVVNRGDEKGMIGKAVMLSKMI